MKEDLDRKYLPIILIILGISIIWFTGVFLVCGIDEESVRFNVRLSARLSVTCFSLAFAASSLHLLFPNQLTQRLLIYRRHLGVSFAWIHLIHLMFLIQLQGYFYPVLMEEPILKLVPGILAYIFVVLLLLTSYKPFAQMISRTNWSRLHTIGGYWILFIFSNSMIGRVVSGKMEYLPWGILVAAVWIVRLWAWRRRSE